MTSKSKDFHKDKKGNLKILVTNVESLSALTPTYIHTYTLFMLEIYRVAIELISSRK